MTRGVTRDKVLRRDALPVPETLPTKTRCIQVEIPDALEYELQFYSILRLLTKWNSYQQDGGHKAADVAYLWKQVLKLTDCDDKSDTGFFDGVFVEDCMTSGFRVNPDNNCQLQIWCNGDWELFWDISSCVSENVKQATNGIPITAGDCREWDVALDSWGKWLLPVAVNAGDTIEITKVSGATNDGSSLLWKCPDGQTFVFNACSGGQAVDGSDVAPTIYHQRLIASVDGTFYDAYNTVISVPSGVTDGQVFLQVNTAALVGNAGSLSFHVKVCNRAQPTWSHVFDFQNDGTLGWVVASGGSPIAFYSAGNGFHVDNPSAAPGQGGLLIRRDFGIAQITHVEVFAESDTALSAAGRAVALTMNATSVAQVSMPDATGEQDYDVAAAGICNICYVAYTCAAAGTHSNIRKVIVYGVGFNPFA